ncbi:hypothetical protein BT93_G1362 [Corymbia citriodora subsp. variegata]|nr:hypothetical protein BT93_G1362 [Corymbia citriodora subsp. variegata]
MPPPSSLLARLASSTSLGSRLSISRLFSLSPPRAPPAMDRTEDSLRKALADRQAAVDAQGNAVRALKAGKAPKPEIDAAIKALNDLKIEKADVEKQLQAAVSGGSGDGSLTREAFRHTVVNTLERRLFYIPSFKIYRGVAGLYDYGPPGCAVKSNVLAYWRQVSRGF